MFFRESHLKDIHDEVLRISGKIEVIGQRNTIADAIHADHEKRIRALEKWRYGFPVSTVAGVVATVLSIYSLAKGGH